MKKFTSRATLWWGTLLCPLAASAQDAPNLALQDPGFEGAFIAVPSKSDADNAAARSGGEVAAGWSDNSNWAPVSVEYGRETANPHGGAAAQRITATRIEGGAVQFVQSVPLRKDHVYEVRLWLRGRPGTAVAVALRQAGGSYTEYVSQRVSLAAEWQEVRAFGTVSDDTDGYFMVKLTEPMTVVVDDASVRDVTEQGNDAAPKLGNLIAGGSFETALMPFGWSARYESDPRGNWADPRPRIDVSTGATGAHSLRAPLPAGASLRVDSPLAEVNYNRPHAAAVWLKASAPLSVQLGLEGTDIGASVNVGTGWQRFTLAGTMPFRRWTRLRLNVAPDAGADRTLWIDGASLEERATAAPEYVPAAPIELALDLGAPGNVIFDGQRALVAVSTGGDLPSGARLQRSAQDLYGTRYALPDVALPAASFVLPTANARPRGMFKLRAQVVDTNGAALSAPVEMIWARLPRPANVPLERSYFGIHAPLAARFVAISQAVGTKWTRLHDTSMITKWPNAEPEPGQWKYYDADVNGTRQMGMGILGMLDGAPGRVSLNPRTQGYWNIWNIPDKPGALDAWADYATHVVSHYKDRINSWEVWNEPWGNWWLEAGGSPELYAQLMQRAHQAAHAANPAATVIGVDTFQGHYEKWTEPVLKAGGTTGFDAFSFHDYTDTLYGGPDALPKTEVEHFAALMNQYGTAKPQWNTEGGSFGIGSWYAPVTGGMAPRDQVGYIVRYDVSYLAQGVRKSFLYAMHSDPPMGEIETRLTEVGNVIKPILAARAVLASLVDGAGTPVRSQPQIGVDQYTFPNGVAVLWSFDGQGHSLTLPKGAKALDAMGNAMATPTAAIEVGPEPIYWAKQGENAS